MNYNERSHQEIETIVNEFGYKLIDEYFIKKHSPRRVIVEDCFGYRYNTTFSKILLYKNERRLSIVHQDNPYSLENISVWLMLNNKNFKLCKSNEYKNKSHKLRLYCLKCREYFLMTWNDIQTGNNCAICRGMQVGITTSLFYLNKFLSNEWIKSENNLTPKDVTKWDGENVFWKCSICDFEWWSTVKNRSKGQNCPKCNESRGEKKVSNFLDLNNIRYTPQCKFDNCKYKRKLPFDFYLLDYNVNIEFNGGQHYFPVDFAGRGIEWAEDQFRQNQMKDKIKEQYCYDNNIPLLIIPYWDFDNIEQILSDYLNLNN